MDLTFLIGVMPILLATGSPSFRLPEGVFPEQTQVIFEAHVLSVLPTAWKPDGDARESRSVTVDFEVSRLLMDRTGKLPPSGRARCDVSQFRWQSEATWKVLGFWSYREIRPDLQVVVFSRAGSTVSYASAFAEPLAAVDVAGEVTLPSQIDFVVQGAKLGWEDQARRLLAQASSERAVGTVLARYLVSLAAQTTGRARQQLVDSIAGLAGGRLSAEGRGELLNSLQERLALEEKPPPDLLHAFEAACLRVLASSETGGAASVSPTLESIAQVYLPWLSKSLPDWKTAPRSALSAAERTKAAEALRWLAGLTRFPERKKEVLRQLAGSLG